VKQKTQLSKSLPGRLEPIKHAQGKRADNRGGRHPFWMRHPHQKVFNIDGLEQK
jgi:hypothetical protein